MSGVLMKILYCRKCNDLFKLTSKERRQCKCGLVTGRYTDHTHAKVSESAVSIKIPNSAFKEAISKMRRLEKTKPNSTDSDYRASSSIPAWVRPNCGPGNPHTTTYTEKLSLELRGRVSKPSTGQISISAKNNAFWGEKAAPVLHDA